MDIVSCPPVGIHISHDNSSASLGKSQCGSPSNPGATTSDRRYFRDRKNNRHYV